MSDIVQALTDCMDRLAIDTESGYGMALDGMTADRDYWRTRALQAEARLDHAYEHVDFILGGLR